MEKLYRQHILKEQVEEKSNFVPVDLLSPKTSKEEEVKEEVFGD
jgi:hypothetical protein